MSPIDWGQKKTAIQKEAEVQERIINALRFERDRRLAQTDGVILRHRDEIDSGVTTSFTSEQYTELLVYRQALRDLPDTTQDLENPVWPEPPTFLTIG